MRSTKILREQFKSPSRNLRPITWYSIESSNPQLTRKKLAYLKKLGLGGICIIPISNRIESEYLSQEFWETVKVIVEEAAVQGMRVWLYDELDYPSGVAGGFVLKNHPEYGVTGLAYQEIEVIGGKRIETPLLGGEPVAVLAEKNSKPGIFLDLKDMVSSGKLIWNVPPGEWKIHFFTKQIIHNMVNIHEYCWRRPYINIMDPNAIREFISLTYEGYARTVGRYFGNVIEAIFTDEPAIHLAGFWNIPPIAQGRPPMLPWVEGFPEYFYARKGYEIVPKLPHLLKKIGPETSKIRCDYWEVVSDLIVNSYFVQLQQWCMRHDIAFTGHLLLEESLMLHLMFSGSLFRCMARMDIPGIDLIGPRPNKSMLEDTMPGWGGPWVPKLASSAAHTRGKSEVMSESFAASGVEMTLEKLIAISNWEFVSGVTELLPMNVHYRIHALAYKLPEGTSKTLKEDKFFDNPDFYATYLSRLKLLLSGGQHIAEVAMLVPEVSIWANYVPASIGSSLDEYRRKNPIAAEIDDHFVALSKELLQNQIDFDYLDDEAFQMAKINEGKIHLANETYSILILPSSTIIRWAVAKKIHDFWRSGGIVIATGRLPNEAMEYGKDNSVREIMEEMFGAEKDIRSVHASKIDEVIETIRKLWKVDVRLAQPDPKVYYLHKRKNNLDIYFLVNNEDKFKNLKITFKCRGVPEIWNPKNGEIVKANPLYSAEETQLSLTLEEFSGLFVVFSR